MKPYGKSMAINGTRKSTQIDFAHWLVICMLRSVFKKLHRDLSDEKDDDFIPRWKLLRRKRKDK